MAEEAKPARTIDLSRGTARYFHSGIRMLLHERAPDALNQTLAIPDLAQAFPNAKSWIGTHVLNVGLTSGLSPDRRALFLSIVRRASHTLAHYISARDRTLRYAQWDCSGALPASDYFGAIEDWENCLLQFQIMIDLMNQSIRGTDIPRAYERGDGSVTERMCEAANRVKHSTRIQSTTIELTPLWLERDGIGVMDGYSIGYAELAEELREAFTMAQDLVNPLALSERLKSGRDSSNN